MEQLSLAWEPERRLYTVKSLTAELRGLLAERFDDVWVAGEISGAKLAASGHYYFTLKDDEAQLRCVCFRQVARYLKFRPQDGIQALARGRIEVYEPRGEYQLQVEALEPQGFGALQFAFEQLKKKLAAEGLFDPARKRPLPKLPRRIAIVTSPTGAVIRDMLNILGRRFPGLHIRLYPAQVQGEGSIEQVVRGIDYFSQSGWAEVVIVARGGGSLEDLWTFNEEAVARAIATCSVPVISAVGHETDFTIADFVADLRAPTPSAAAELVVPTRDSLLEQIAARLSQIEQAARYRLAQAARRLEQQGIGRVTAVVQRRIGRTMQRVDELDYRLRGRARALVDAAGRHWRERDERLRKLDLRLRLAAAHRRLDSAASSAERIAGLRLARSRARLDELDAHLRQLSPLAVLDRGYAIVEKSDGRVVRAAEDAPEGTDVGVRLAKGRLKARVTASTPD
ncbi:MAG: exodeoxyribonuclease VII large subunit [Acidobacteria bacterium]|nr:exodeoxyribonuclease VII large subunit [Acidobacteriota bacterium]